MKRESRQLHIATLYAAYLTACALPRCAVAEERIERRGAEPQETAIAADVAVPHEEDADQSTSGEEQASGHGKRAELDDVMQFAQQAYARIDAEIADYACLLIKRERVDGKDRGWQFMQAKIRHERKSGDQIETPFSVYVKFLQPKSVAGREVLYVQNRYNGDLIARRVGLAVQT